MANPEFIQAVYQTIAKIPLGKVTTYGQIAYMIGHPKNARLVGNVLKHVDRSLSMPCHRVVNASGRTVPGWHEQIELLKKEHVPFKENGCVDLKRSFWQG
ncbi:methylated-DNA--protein-cysteine methyltransferase [Listeria floridensis FSL S10-1187]|uniref:Methylated-DNA--protein-cysteine methyltransferase n=1 Tax=Listeria floridensis FSL S10-1187 TaxID=1265817 RepID=A0ABN0RDV8_9LIST|nr:MGMT family protein [Listeria floridensis]EUJ30264.1 methylated-DNA--protein-cysteine methyltransferase [Listeria floridensis FSL S10-1187]